MDNSNPISNNFQFKDLTGLRFHKLVAIRPAYKKKKYGYYWECVCDCNNKTIVLANSLLQKKTKSCGCLRVEKQKTHGHTQNGHTSLEYNSWDSMIQRCTNPNTREYGRYGGRGIFVCERWRVSFENFLTDVGPRSSSKHSLDRINNDGNYSCGHCQQCIDRGWSANCRWATRKDQQRNMSTTRFVTFGNETRPLIEWSEILDISLDILRYRLYKRGWSVENALTKPIGTRVPIKFL